MIEVVGATAAEVAAVEAAVARVTGRPTALAELGDGHGTVTFDRTRPVEQAVLEVAELIAPLGDGRIDGARAAEHLATIDALRRLAGALDAPGAAWTPDAVAMRDALTAQLRGDTSTPWIWGAWGSAAVQEHDADEPTVSPGVLRWLDDTEGRGGGPALGQGATHHAGALHTYGYLCSGLATTYGWKRTRWVGGGVAAATGIDPALLMPRPATGTLLGNVTTLAARLLGWSSGAGANDDVRPVATWLGTLVETATSQPADGDDGDRPLDDPIVMRTSLHRAGGGRSLLIYTVEHRGSERLITMFDVLDAKVAEVLTPPPDGDVVPVRLRYNSVVAGVGTAFTGTAFVDRPAG